MITKTIEIDRRPEDVFAYLDEHERHREWQREIVSAKVQTEGSVRVGTRVSETRKLGGREQDTSYEITEHDPPRRSSFRGVAGPVRPVGTVTVEPVGDGSRSSVSIDFDLVGHGWLGRVIAPLARRRARKTIVDGQAQLKQRLESGA